MLVHDWRAEAVDFEPALPMRLVVLPPDRQDFAVLVDELSRTVESAVLELAFVPA